MPRAWYLERIDSGDIDQGDLEWALANAHQDLRPGSVPSLLARHRQPAERPAALPTVADLAAEVSGIGLARVDHGAFGAWCVRLL